jgi:hypothetical protein
MHTCTFISQLSKLPIFEYLFALTLYLMAMGPIGQTQWTKYHKKLSRKTLKNYLFVDDDLRNTFYFRQFVPTITEIAELTPKVLGQIS